MTRRQALAALLLIVGRGEAGAAPPPNYNVLIDLDQLKAWEIKLGDQAILITGEELFRALRR